MRSIEYNAEMARTLQSCQSPIDQERSPDMYKLCNTYRQGAKVNVFECAANRVVDIAINLIPTFPFFTDDPWFWKVTIAASLILVVVQLPSLALWTQEITRRRAVSAADEKSSYQKSQPPSPIFFVNPDAFRGISKRQTYLPYPGITELEEEQETN